METYTFLRQIADSWALLLLFLFFLGVFFWAWRPGSRPLHDDAAEVPFRYDDADGMPVWHDDAAEVPFRHDHPNGMPFRHDAPDDHAARDAGRGKDTTYGGERQQ